MWWLDLAMLFFPVTCIICGKRLGSFTDVLCLECEYNLPRTGFRDHVNNPVSRAFWGRIPLEMGTSLLRFDKGSAYQSLLHELKYKGNRRVGYYLGRLLGKELIHSSFDSCDIMVPVPLHPKRHRKRGYNQSEIIASGISLVTGIPVVTDLLERTVHHHSQISLGRYERFRNISGNFRVSTNAPDVNGLKILLVDDVVTTGSTLEACGLELLRKFSCTICMATLSCA
jgi:ComF family protein